MLSNLPKLLDRNFVLGFFLPALLFGVTVLLLLWDYDFAHSMLDSLLAKDVTTAAYGAAAVWLVAVLLLLLNYWSYRLLEGYLPPLSWRRRARRRFWQSVQQRQAEAAGLRSRHARGGLSADELVRYGALRLWLSQMPGSEADMMPTRFGNAIKSFETYPRDIHGADGVVLWQRLYAVMSKEYADAVQDSRTQVDFQVNCCMLAMLVGLVALVMAVQQTPFAIMTQDAGLALEQSYHAAVADGITGSGLLAIWSPMLCLIPFGKLIWFAAMSAASRMFYCLAVAAIPAWGDLVMAAYDCYLPKLAEQLGFALPRSDAQRRRFWQEFSDMATYRPFGGSRPAFRAEHWLFPPKH